MKNIIYPTGYNSALSGRETQKAIKLIKDTFQVSLAKSLNLERVTAPLFVSSASGLNDDLNGVERKVHFTIKEIDSIYIGIRSCENYEEINRKLNELNGDISKEENKIGRAHV